MISPTVKRGLDHTGVYNQPTVLKEVQVLMADSLTEKKHCIVIWKRRENGALQFISDIHRSFDPLHNPLLFPQGKDSLYAGMASSFTNATEPSKQLSVWDFYAYHLHQRNNEREMLFQSATLFQEYCCCGWSQIERQRLLYLMQNQQRLWAENYNILQDHINSTDALHEKERVGKALILYLSQWRWI